MAKRVVQALLPVSRGIDAFNGTIGRWLSWLVLVAVLISAGNAIVRKVFDTSSNAWLELQWILFSAIFLLCSPWTLLRNEHIRIDIVNSLLSRTTRNVIDVVGHAGFLLPLTIVMIVTGIPFFYHSLLINEQSPSAGGLAQWPAKFLVPLGFALLTAQGVSELIKRLAIMAGLVEEAGAGGGHHASAEEEAKRLLEGLKAEER